MSRHRAPLARLSMLAALLGLLALPDIGIARDLPGVGPCTARAAASMPVGEGHDHIDITQHQFRCRLALAFFDPLTDELAAEEDVILGEFDIETRPDGTSILGVGVAFPEAGALFYDVTDPASPVFLSWFRASKCEELVFDVDCGAYLDLSEDGMVAFLSLQDITVLPQSPPDPGVRPITEIGVEVIDIRDPSRPLLTQSYPVLSIGGVHTSNSHVIPEDASDPDPRAPGEYLFSIANGFGIEITEVHRVGGFPLLTPVIRMDIDETHDMFLDNDALTGRTYMYVAAGFSSGFYVYDVTDPSEPELLAEWDPTPECGEDWYGHTTYTVVRNQHRFVTIDAEVFGGNGEFGRQDAEDQAEGCGEFVGNGDKPGPLWIVDATDFSTLQPADDQDGEESGETAAALKQASLDALVTTWTNPANRPGGNIEFSPHNQQVVRNKIYLSHYHGGVYVLDAREAFRGRDVRPAELAFAVPHQEPTRPLYEPPVTEPLSPFIAGFFRARPTVWDALFHKGYFIAIDSVGGFYSYTEQRRR